MGTKAERNFAWDAYCGDTSLIDCAESIGGDSLSDVTHWDMRGHRLYRREMTLSYWKQFQKAQPRHSREYPSSVRLLAKTIIHMRWFVIYSRIEDVLRSEFKEKHGVSPDRSDVSHPDPQGTILLIAEGILGKDGVEHIIMTCYPQRANLEEIKIYQGLKDSDNATYVALKRKYWYAPTPSGKRAGWDVPEDAAEEPGGIAKRRRRAATVFTERLDELYARSLKAVWGCDFDAVSKEFEAWSAENAKEREKEFDKAAEEFEKERECEKDEVVIEKQSV